MNTLIYLLAACGYVVVGAIWSFLRWTRYLSNELDYYERERQRFLWFHRIRGEEIPDFLRFEWRAIVKVNERLSAVPPKIQDYRGTIAFDGIAWPLSVVIVAGQKTYAVIMERVLAQFKRITESKIERVRKDLKG